MFTSKATIPVKGELATKLAALDKEAKAIGAQIDKSVEVRLVDLDAERAEKAAVNSQIAALTQRAEFAETLLVEQQKRIEVMVTADIPKTHVDVIVQALDGARMKLLPTKADDNKSAAAPAPAEQHRALNGDARAA